LGIVGTCGQLLLTRAYSLAPANKVGPFTYSSIIFASLIGWIFWDEKITLLTLSGAMLIIFAGLLIFREKQFKEHPKAPLSETIS